MTITAKHAARRLHAANQMMTKVVTNLPAAISAMHAHIDQGDQRDDGRSRAEDAGIRSIGGHNDPTGDTAIARTSAHERHLDDVEAHLATLTLSLGLLVDACNRWVAPVWATEAHPRCSGGKGYGVEPWTKPDCGELVECDTRKDGSPSYRQHGLCVRCRKARDRWNAENPGAA